MANKFLGTMVMDISTEGDAADGTETVSDCKYGDTITFSFTGTFPVSFSEIKINGIVRGECMKTGELEAYLQIILEQKHWLLILTGGNDCRKECSKEPRYLKKPGVTFGRTLCTW